MSTEECMAFCLCFKALTALIKGLKKLERAEKPTHC
jgi:hypothetical protein